MKGRLPLRTYKTILKNIPLSTTDLVVTRWSGRDMNYGLEFLLGTRRNPPHRGKWFLPGGKQNKGELLRDSALRNLGRELGVGARWMKFLTCYDFFGTNKLGIRYHSVMHVYVCEINSGDELRPNSEHTSLRWFRKIDPRWPIAVRTILKNAGFS